MIKIDNVDLLKLNRVVKCPKGAFESMRYLISSDNMGFTLTRTIVYPGQPWRWHYKRHLEACLCISGRGKLTIEKTGNVYDINLWTMYALDKNDAHLFEAIGGPVELICVFNPPLCGNEIHQEDGSYV